jgi:hypothetical protein
LKKSNDNGEATVTLKTHHGSCHCGAVRFEADIDLAKASNKCNCSICTKARAWFAFVGGDQFRLRSGAEALTEYRWTPPAKPEPFLTYAFCRNCGIRIYGTGDNPKGGGRMYAISIAALDDIDADELAAAPVNYIDGRHDRFNEAPTDKRLM